MAFSIIGPALDFDGISTAMNQDCAKITRAGTKILLRLQTEDVWSIGSPIGPLMPLEDHLRWLHSQLEPHVNYLACLPKTARARIYIGFTLFQEQNGFAILPESIRLFATLNAEIEMYILCNFGDDLEADDGEAAHK